MPDQLESQKVVEYTIVYSKDASEFMQAVNGFIGEGWQPIGGVSVNTITGDYPSIRWYQALVKYAPLEGEKK